MQDISVLFKIRVKCPWEEDPPGYVSKSAGWITLPLPQFSFEDFLQGARRREQISLGGLLFCSDHGTDAAMDGT